MLTTETMVRHLHDPRRIAALQRTALLDTPAELAFDRLTRLAAKLVQAPVSVVSLLDEERQFFKSSYGLPGPLAAIRTLPHKEFYCRHVVDTRQPLLIEDARLDPATRTIQAFIRLGFVAYAGVPLATVQGDVLGTVCVLDRVPRPWSGAEVSDLADLATLVMTEIDLRTTRRDEQEGREAVALRDEFLSIASHELKTPLTPLQLQLDLIRHTIGSGEIDADKLRARIEVASRQTSRLAHLVDRLLDVSRISAGRLELVRDAVDLAELTTELVDRLRGEAEKAGCPLTVDLVQAAGIWDRSRLEQLITNLLSNAFKYGAGGAVHVCVERVDDSARLTIRDHGIGIAPEDLARIFDRFERAVSARNAGGLGLGLYIAREITAAHGGALEVESTPGGGSTFTVTLPRVAVGDAAATRDRRVDRDEPDERSSKAG